MAGFPVNQTRPGRGARHERKRAPPPGATIALWPVARRAARLGWVGPVFSLRTLNPPGSRQA